MNVFAVRAAELIEDRPELAATVEMLLRARQLSSGRSRMLEDVKSRVKLPKRQAMPLRTDVVARTKPLGTLQELKPTPFCNAAMLIQKYRSA
jgi:hypothetical protein